MLNLQQSKTVLLSTDLHAVATNDILFINRLTAPPSLMAPPAISAILSSRDCSIAGYS